MNYFLSGFWTGMLLFDVFRASLVWSLTDVAFAVTFGVFARIGARRRGTV